MSPRYSWIQLVLSVAVALAIAPTVARRAGSQRRSLAANATAGNWVYDGPDRVAMPQYGLIQAVSGDSSEPAACNELDCSISGRLEFRVSVAGAQDWHTTALLIIRSLVSYAGVSADAFKLSKADTGDDVPLAIPVLRASDVRDCILHGNPCQAQDLTAVSATPTPSPSASVTPSSSSSASSSATSSATVSSSSSPSSSSAATPSTTATVSSSSSPSSSSAATPSTAASAAGTAATSAQGSPSASASAAGSASAFASATGSPASAASAQGSVSAGVTPQSSPSAQAIPFRQRRMQAASSDVALSSRVFLTFYAVFGPADDAQAMAQEIQTALASGLLGTVLRTAGMGDAVLDVDALRFVAAAVGATTQVHYEQVVVLAAAADGAQVVALPVDTSELQVSAIVLAAVPEQLSVFHLSSNWKQHRLPPMAGQAWRIGQALAADEVAFVLQEGGDPQTAMAAYGLMQYTVLASAGASRRQLWVVPSSAVVLQSQFWFDVDGWTVVHNGATAAAQSHGGLQHESYTDLLVSRFVLGVEELVQVDPGASTDSARWAFQSPANWHTLAPAAYGGALSFDMVGLEGSFEEATGNDLPLVKLSCTACAGGAGATMVHMVSAASVHGLMSTGVHWEVPLAPSAWQMQPAQANEVLRPVLACELAGMLHSMDSLQILGDVLPGYETVGLDNVQLRAASTEAGTRLHPDYAVLQVAALPSSCL